MMNPTEMENSIYKKKTEKEPVPYKPKPKAIFKGLARKRNPKQ